MTRKEQLINDILVGMRVHLAAQLMTVLHEVIVQAMYGVDITEAQTELATVDNSNGYILELFAIKKAPKLSAKTAEQYVTYINALVALINKPLVGMTESDIEYFLMCYKKRGISNVTVNNARRYLSAFFTWMRRAKLIRENPVENVDAYKETDKMIEHLEPEQWEQLKTGCKSVRDRALIEFLRCTAMRDGEVPAVHICDVDWHDGCITIYGHKTDRYRVVCIDRVAQDYLNRYLVERGVSHFSKEPLFVARGTSKSLSNSGIYSAIKAIARRAQLNVNVYPHLLRKTTATNIIRRGGSTEEAGEYLGHAERNTAGRHYAYKGDDHIVQIFKQRVAAI